ncbi:phosphatidylglycerol/phosphatidylinositol transfer protein [Blastomyces dermatitidis ER-3]|uniref:Phosphatidylglycerol/phosphatidylinositol transfer protein n=2 Tax=Ajellomyces dermatitidis TaxID=5039 RepID=F2TKH9_AJEDA|nr:phosphatidylglycerol/phosphatidylinositol transfer protein [Blastomyces dermatitidis ER-3]EEQ91301.1 phosphatidylglycerol/phosphatidylinositol transfer protein [Blastomyces dermatitidis ER-3]EGE83742.1 hypothetical protein BDDG_06687 [Blastomyces dermatitidis ATCC 18188]
MRLTTTPLFVLLWSSLAVGAPPSLPWVANNQVPISLAGNELRVPGDNPLNFCFPPENDILTINWVDLSPNPPVPGQTLTITASGTFHKQVDEGSKVQIQVKYGLIRLVNQEADLCDEIKNVDLECPLEKGNTSFTKKVDLPKEIPPGRYTVLADVYTNKKERITCLQAEVTFSL